MNSSLGIKIKKGLSIEPLSFVKDFYDSSKIEQELIIIECCEKKKFDYIKLLLIDITDNNHQQRQRQKIRKFKFLNCKSPLMVCAIKGYLEVFELISQFPTVDWGINYCCSYGNSALHYAVKNSNEEFVKELLLFGADVNLINNLNQNALQMACCNRYTNHLIVQNLIEFHKTTDSLDSVNNLDNEGKAALHYRCQYATGYHILLVNGADPNILDSNNQTPLHYAAVEGFDPVVHVLLNYGCDPNRQNIWGKTALHYVVQKGHFIAVVSLIQFKAHLDLVDNEGKTALHVAIESGNNEIIKALMVANCSVNGINSGNDVASPLELSLGLRNYCVAVCLILFGCDLGPLWTLFPVRIVRLLRSIRKRENISLPLNSMEDVVDDSDDDLVSSNSNENLLDWMINQAIQSPCLKQICRIKIRTLTRQKESSHFKEFIISNSCSRAHEENDTINLQVFDDLKNQLPISLVHYLNYSFLDFQNPLRMLDN